MKQLRWFGRRARFHPCASVTYDGSGFLFEQDTWEPRSLFLRDIPDVVRAYELLESSYPGMSANVIALVHYKSDEVMHYVGNGNEIEVENVVATEYHHDCENETYGTGRRTCRRLALSVQRSLAPLSRAMMPARCATRNCNPSFIKIALVPSDPRLYTFAEI